MNKSDLMDLMEKTRHCETVESLRALMEARGIWLNDAAAQSAFKAIENARASTLGDAELAGVTGGAQPARLETDAGVLARNEAEQILLTMLERFIA